MNPKLALAIANVSASTCILAIIGRYSFAGENIEI
jgi:hypothetical protein